MLRSSNTCYNAAAHPVSTIVPVGFTPSPAIYRPPRSASPKEPRKHTLEHTPSPNPCFSSHGLQSLTDNVPSACTDIIDISSFLREHYNGQVRTKSSLNYLIISTYTLYYIDIFIWPFQCPPELLEAMSLHQAKCFHHVQSFSKALKAALSKENANFAMRIIQQANLNPGILAAGNTHSPLPARQIQYTDTPSCTPLRTGLSVEG